MCLQPILRLTCEDRLCTFSQTIPQEIEKLRCEAWCTGRKIHREYSPKAPETYFKYETVSTLDCPSCQERHAERVAEEQVIAQQDFDRLVQQLPQSAFIHMAAKKAWEAAKAKADTAKAAEAAKAAAAKAEMEQMTKEFPDLCYALRFRYVKNIT